MSPWWEPRHDDYDFYDDFFHFISRLKHVQALREKPRPQNLLDIAWSSCWDNFKLCIFFILYLYFVSSFPSDLLRDASDHSASSEQEQGIVDDDEFSVGKGSASDFVTNMRFVNKYERSFPNSMFTQKTSNLRIATFEICNNCVNALKCYQIKWKLLVFTRIVLQQIYKAREFLHGCHSRQISIIVSLIIPNKYWNIVCPVVLVLSSWIIGG